MPLPTPMLMPWSQMICANENNDKHLPLFLHVENVFENHNRSKLSRLVYFRTKRTK